MQHWAFLVSNQANNHGLAKEILEGSLALKFDWQKNAKGVEFSAVTLNAFINEELIHGHQYVTKDKNQPLNTMSSGEQKKALLDYLILQDPNFIILINPFDHLDIAGQAALKERLIGIASHTQVVQIVNRQRDILPFITHVIREVEGRYHEEDVKSFLNNSSKSNLYRFSGKVPLPLKENIAEVETLVQFKNVSIKYEDKAVLKDIDWSIKQGEFWQLVGPNGSGKTTILTLINGDNAKAYGQDITLFGTKKGSGESVWQIKEKVGYLTPSMADRFTRRHTVAQMVISGFFDSIGLYVRPSEWQKNLAKEWLELIELYDIRDKAFCDISLGQQRMVLIARSMVKHPYLLILDEPTAGLDDHNVQILTALINKIAEESTTAILYVSHRTENGLQPEKVFELVPSEEGSKGIEKEYV